jgi:hypothetical protein
VSWSGGAGGSGIGTNASKASSPLLSLPVLRFMLARDRL